MPAIRRLKAAHDIYGAYASGDRRVVEELLSDDFILYSPADVGIGRERSKVRQPRDTQIHAFAMKWDLLCLEQLALASALGQ